MSKISLWIGIALALAGCAMTVLVVVGQQWIIKHAWIIWLFFGGALLAFFMALREVQWFRRCFWKVTHHLVSEPLPSPALPSGGIAPKEEAKQRLSIRITDGLVDRQSNDPWTMVILLNVRVGLPESEIKGWRLELCHGGKKKTAYQQPMPRPLAYSSPAVVNEQPAGTITEAVPLPSHVPDKGWILFTVPNVSKEFDDYVFGATFTLTGIETDLTESTLEKPVGEWLHRGKIHY